MMAQLLAHLWGDYILQSDWMAQNKSKPSGTGAAACLAHACFYTLCFVPLVWGGSVDRGCGLLGTIFWSHFWIDRYGLVRYVVWAKNWISPQGTAPWRDCKSTGYPPDRPVWLSVWLLIIADNTLHLTCNYLALRFL